MAPRGKREILITITGDGSDAVRATQRVGQASGDLADKVDKAGTVMLGAGGLMAVGLFKAGQSASNLEQSVGAVESVLGPAADRITSFGETADEKFGLSKRAVNEMAASTGALLKGFGFDVDEAADAVLRIEERGADMAATFGGSTEEAIQAVSAALRGERDPIERYGAAFNEAAVQAKILELGLDTSTAAAEQNAKAVASLEIIMSKTADTEGQFAREADGAAGAAARATAKLENASAELGKNTLPLLAGGADLLADLASGFAGLPEPIQDFIAKTAIGTTGLLLLGGMGIKAATSIRNVRAELLLLNASSNVVARNIGQITGALGILATAGLVGLALWTRRMEQAEEHVASFGQSVRENLDLGGASYDELNAAVARITDGIIELNDAADASTSPLDADYRAELRLGAEELERVRDEVNMLTEAARDMARRSGYEITTEKALKLVQAQQDLTGETDAAALAAETHAEKLDQTGESMDALADNIRGWFDPLFKAQNAQRQLTESQVAYAEAVREHGEGSIEAQTAAENLAPALLEAEEASRELNLAVEAGTVSLDAAKQKVEDWVGVGAITRAEADKIILGFDGIITKGEKLTEAKPRVDLQTNSWLVIDALKKAEEQFFGFRRRVIGVGPISLNADVYVPRRRSHSGGPAGAPRGMEVDHTLEGGEYVLDAGTVDAIKQGRPSRGAARGLRSGGASSSDVTREDLRYLGKEIAREVGLVVAREMKDVNLRVDVGQMSKAIEREDRAKR